MNSVDNIEAFRYLLTMDIIAPKIGDYVTVGSVSGVVVEVFDFGTLIIETANGDQFKATGLGWIKAE